MTMIYQVRVELTEAQHALMRYLATLRRQTQREFLTAAVLQELTEAPELKVQEEQ